ncbi:MAG: UDP-N-acetylmuramoyl-tripeptide--D-alanyl-D-alanine ligase [Bacteroidetes bacterium]|nr:MAG: UDP-N-acetylmuramoyl-tripeptide--D-alanyl-D-alanine ligase [Bacteroidota bacterium]
MQLLPSIQHLYGLYTRSYKVCTDTRNIIEGSIFFALKGANFNGNLFAADALEKGAAYAVVDEEIATTDERILKTDDALQALQQLANYHRRQLNIPVIAVGGSNGKTTTKELLLAVLSKKYNTLATGGNLNNHIGVPLTLLSITPQVEIAVIEMGTNQPGDMELLCQIAEPNYGITTNIGKEHLEGFGGIEGVAKEESMLYLHLLHHNGLAFVNANDEWLVRMASRLERQYKYGYDTEQRKITSADYKGELLSVNPFIEAVLPYGAGVIKANLSGEYNFQNIMAAASIGHYFEVEAEQIKAAVEVYAPTNNRSQVVKRGSNVLYMDCYNANPSSMEVALRNFAGFETPNKIVVIGDMLELGSFAPAEHEAMATLCKQLGFETVYFVGPIFAPYAQIANARHFENSTLLREHFLVQKPQNSYILFKASRGIALEKAAAAFE